MSPPPAHYSSPEGSILSDPDASSPEMDVFVSIDSTEGGPTQGFDFEQYMKDAEASSRTKSGFYESTGIEVDKSRVNDDLVGRFWRCGWLADLSALGIPFNSPANPRSSQEVASQSSQLAQSSQSSSLSQSVQPMSHDILNDFYGPQEQEEQEEEEEEVPEGFIKPGVIRRSRQLRLEKGIGVRRVPSFRKRVVLLPPLPISRQQDRTKDPNKEKQVRFFTNVICHEYQSY